MIDISSLKKCKCGDETWVNPCPTCGYDVWKEKGMPIKEALEAGKELFKPTNKYITKIPIYEHRKEQHNANKTKKKPSEV